MSIIYKRMMHQLINSWNKTHKPYFLVVNCFPYFSTGINLERWTLYVYNMDAGVKVYESEGESFIKLYNKLEDEWDKIKGDSE